LITNTTAKLVKINRKIRFIQSSPLTKNYAAQLTITSTALAACWGSIVRFQELPGNGKLTTA
jgi:hypothetical protein